MRYRVIIPILSILLLITGCAGTATSEVNASSEVLSSKDTKKTVGDVARSYLEATPGAVSANWLSSAELDEITKIFEALEYNVFLDEPFNDPYDIDWNVILDGGAGVCKTDISDEEVSEYLSAKKEKRIYEDLLAITKPEFTDFIKTHVGIDYDENRIKFSWLYLENRDSFYYESWHFNKNYTGKKYKCVSGEKTGDKYTLRFRPESKKHYGTDADRILTLTKSGENLIMESNKILWDDHCDESRTFDVNLSQYDGPVRFITYPFDSQNEASIILVKDGKYIQTLESGMVWRGDKRCYLQEVLDVDFFDYNADGDEDIVIIGDTVMGKVLLLEESVQGYFNSSYEMEETIEEELGRDNLSIEKVKSLLMGDNAECRFDNYKDAYAYVTRLNNMSNENYTYDLIYVDDDDIPELVIDAPGYYVSFYSYKDGYVTCTMDHWPYGAMGNVGYTYVPRKNIIFNSNYDHAGLIEYVTYGSIREDGTLGADYEAEYLYFDDVDGDGSPSSEEDMAATDDCHLYEAIYYNNTDQDMTDDEIKAQIEKLDKYKYEELNGSMSYDELLKKLQ